jgi:hypothetical protein
MAVQAGCDQRGDRADATTFSGIKNALEGISDSTALVHAT